MGRSCDAPRRASLDNGAVAPALHSCLVVDVMTKPSFTSFTKWALVAAGVSAVGLVLRKLGRSRRAPDLGAVSEEWVAEHLVGRGSRS